LALVEVSVVEQRYRAVLEVRSGVSVTEVAARFGVSRQSVHSWIRRYAEGGLGALADRARRPESSPGQVPAGVEAAVCEVHRETRSGDRFHHWRYPIMKTRYERRHQDTGLAGAQACRVPSSA
jgi:transposase